MAVVVITAEIRSVRRGDGLNIEAPIGGMLAAAGLSALAGPAPDMAVGLTAIAVIATAVDPDGTVQLAEAAGSLLDRGPSRAVPSAGATDDADERRFGAALLAAAQGAQVGTELGDTVGTNLTTFTSPAGQKITASPRFAAKLVPLLQQAALAGHMLRGSAYRSAARQIELRKAHCPDWQNSPSSDCSPPTAKPGTSRHETGDAIDFSNLSAVEFRWLQQNAGRFGIKNFSDERWHWSIDGK